MDKIPFEMITVAVLPGGVVNAREKQQVTCFGLEVERKTTGYEPFDLDVSIH